MSTNANADATGSPCKIGLIEFHDARVGSFTIQSGGSGVLSFNHICVYIEKSFEHYDVWSYRADLLFQGIENISLDRLLGSSDYVSDGYVYGVDGCEIELASALERRSVDKVELVLSSSANLSLKVSHVQLKLIAPLEKLEEWIGPLYSSGK